MSGSEETGETETGGRDTPKADTAEAGASTTGATTTGASKKGAAEPDPTKVPVGGYVLLDDPVELNVGRPRLELTVRNTGDRPIQVGSHFHFMEANRALSFDRAAAFGWRLDIAAGTAVRFEPGDEKTVTLVPFGGKQRIHGFNSLVDGWGPTHAPYRPRLARAVALAKEFGFKFEDR